MDPVHADLVLTERGYVPNGAKLSRFCTVPPAMWDVLHLGSVRGQHCVRFWPSLDAAWLTSAGPVWHDGSGDDLAHQVDQVAHIARVYAGLNELRLPVSQGLQTGFEAHPAQGNGIGLSRLHHEQPKAVVNDQMHEDFLAHHGRCLSAQNVHTQCRLQVAKIQFNGPALVVQIGQIVGGVLIRIGQRRDNRSRECGIRDDQR